MFVAGGAVSAVGAGGVADIMGHKTSKTNSTISVRVSTFLTERILEGTGDVPICGLTCGQS